MLLTRARFGEWFGVEYNMNLYRGCCHGCIYCDSRSECYGVEAFGTVKAKEGALGILREELRRARPGVVSTGSMSDPYNPLERKYRLTRQALEMLAERGFGVAIATKSPLVARDADVLRRIAERAPVLVKMTITAADDALCARVEPHVQRTGARLEALRTLADAGVFCGVLLMPVLPFITDDAHNLREITRLAAQSGARFVYPELGVTLRDRQREHFFRALDRDFPGLRARYVRAYGNRYACAPPGAEELLKGFQAACRAQGLLCGMPEIIAAYRAGYGQEQISFADLGEA